MTLQESTPQYLPTPTSWGAPCLLMFLLLLHLGMLLIIRCPSMSSLTLVCEISNGFAINPGRTLSKHPLGIHAKPIDSHLILGRVLKSILLRVGGEWELNLGLTPVVVRHDDDGQEDRR